MSRGRTERITRWREERKKTLEGEAGEPLNEKTDVPLGGEATVILVFLPRPKRWVTQLAR